MYFFFFGMYIILQLYITKIRNYFISYYNITHNSLKITKKYYLCNVLKYRTHILLYPPSIEYVLKLMFNS